MLSLQQRVLGTEKILPDCKFDFDLTISLLKLNTSQIDLINFSKDYISYNIAAELFITYLLLEYDYVRFGNPCMDSSDHVKLSGNILSKGFLTEVYTSSDDIIKICKLGTSIGYLLDDFRFVLPKGTTVHRGFNTSYALKDWFDKSIKPFVEDNHEFGKLTCDIVCQNSEVARFLVTGEAMSFDKDWIDDKGNLLKSWSFWWLDKPIKKSIKVKQKQNTFLKYWNLSGSKNIFSIKKVSKIDESTYSTDGYSIEPIPVTFDRETRLNGTIHAEGIFYPETKRLTVLKGSIIANGVVTTKDEDFKSPSGAGCFVYNKMANGWTSWFYGKVSLDDLFRKNEPVSVVINDNLDDIKLLDVIITENQEDNKSMLSSTSVSKRVSDTDVIQTEFNGALPISLDKDHIQKIEVMNQTTYGVLMRPNKIDVKSDTKKVLEANIALEVIDYKAYEDGLDNAKAGNFTIFVGASGTGKTRLAHQVASAYTEYDCSYSNKNKGHLLKKVCNNAGRFEVWGGRTINDNYTAGILAETYLTANENPDEKIAGILDEILRCNIEDALGECYDMLFNKGADAAINGVRFENTENLALLATGNIGSGLDSVSLEGSVLSRAVVITVVGIFRSEDSTIRFFNNMKKLYSNSWNCTTLNLLEYSILKLSEIVREESSEYFKIRQYADMREIEKIIKVVAVVKSKQDLTDKDFYDNIFNKDFLRRFFKTPLLRDENIGNLLTKVTAK